MRKMRNIRIVGTRAKNIALNLENASHMKRCLLTLLITPFLVKYSAVICGSSLFKFEIHLILAYILIYVQYLHTIKQNFQVGFVYPQ